MKKNVGTIDKFIRMAIGLALIAFIFIWDGPSRWLGLLGIIPIATALANYCPLYTILKMDTSDKVKK